MIKTREYRAPQSWRPWLVIILSMPASICPYNALIGAVYSLCEWLLPIRYGLRAWQPGPGIVLLSQLPLVALWALAVVLNARKKLSIRVTHTEQSASLEISVSRGKKVLKRWQWTNLVAALSEDRPRLPQFFFAPIAGVTWPRNVAGQTTNGEAIHLFRSDEPGLAMFHLSNPLLDQIVADINRQQLHQWMESDPADIANSPDADFEITPGWDEKPSAPSSASEE